MENFNFHPNFYAYKVNDAIKYADSNLVIEGVSGGVGGNGENIVGTFTMQKVQLNLAPKLGAVGIGEGLRIGLDRDKQIDDLDELGDTWRQVKAEGQRKVVI